MDLRKLKKLIDLVQESGIAELEITEGEEKVKIVKGGEVSVSPAPPVASAATAAQAATPPPPAPAASASAAAAPGAEPPPGEAGHAVKAPMVGTFYRSPSVISSSAIPDSWTRSISFFSLRRSIALGPFSMQNGAF